MIGPTGHPTTLALAWSPDGVLYTFTDSGTEILGTAQLAKFDLETGEAFPYGATNDLRLMGLTFTPDGTLYGAGNTTKSLYTINMETGAPTLVGPLGVAGEVMDLVMHPDGRMLGVDWTDVSLVPAPIGSEQVLTVALQGNAAFFRLIQRPAP